MKKKNIWKWCLGLALFLLIGIYVYFVLTKQRDWKSDLNYVYYGVGVVSALYVAFSPLITEIKNAKNAIDSVSASATNQTAENGQVLTKVEDAITELGATKQALEDTKKNFEDMVEKYKQALEYQNKTINNLMSICKMGFLNSKELVSKGVAEQIAKVGDESENNESEE